MKHNSKSRSASRKQPPENPFDRIFKTALLRSESKRGFEVFRNEIYVELGPQTPIQHLVARQIVNALWQVERHQNLESGILNNASLPALQNLIEPTSFFHGIDTNGLASKYFSDPEANREIQKRLAQLGMKESDVDAEAFRIRAPDLQANDRLRASAQSRAIKLLRTFNELRPRSQVPHSEAMDHVQTDGMDKSRNCDGISADEKEQDA
ncbi:hypothetical protein [Bradyrhizobium sp. JYMT SZCCT0428]|uniref:hypothetical protein n=1 Tax=Bradyrhizobium sp. JYMT SZCCT0428 TaxID=2807673 RepID=UPI001BA994F2|nr:hypothetical protein [Bradyrhizobium sp. JYMT SZCCT0428]MBR1152809.1 hypothetical protein [Bradyrhizobium sp. JYMT SZCCT0428]